MAMKDRIKELRRVPAGQLRPNPRNWRTHSDEQKAALNGMLKEVGISNAVIARELADGSLELIDGHLRQDAIDQEIPVLVLDVNEEEALKLLATLDPLAGLAGTDKQQLESLLEDIDIESSAVTDMLDAMKPAAAGTAESADDVVEDGDELPESDGSITRRGDIWTLGRHRLMCGDSLNADSVELLFDGASPTPMVTDPPYGVQHDTAWRDEAGITQTPGTQQAQDIEWDANANWGQAFKHFPGDVMYVWHASMQTVECLSGILEAGFELRQHIVWVKPHFAVSQAWYHWRHEPCWLAVRAGASANWSGDRKQTTVWEYASPRQAFGAGSNDAVKHPTQKPIGCMAKAIGNHGGELDVVYDPFVGSGTTLIAAEQLGRTCVAMELSPTYCDMVVQRWQRLTGLEATR